MSKLLASLTTSLLYSQKKSVKTSVLCANFFLLVCAISLKKGKEKHEKAADCNIRYFFDTVEPASAAGSRLQQRGTGAL